MIALPLMSDAFFLFQEINLNNSNTPRALMRIGQLNEAWYESKTESSGSKAEYLRTYLL